MEQLNQRILVVGGQVTNFLLAQSCASKFPNIIKLQNITDIFQLFKFILPTK